jgi:hypothetical protein
MLGKAGLHPDIVKGDVHGQVLKNWRAHSSTARLRVHPAPIAFYQYITAFIKRRR